MAIRAEAFGPLSAGTKHAAGLLGGGSMGDSGFSLRRLSGRPSFGEPQTTPVVESPVGLATGAQAPVEEQTPLLPAGEATGERGDLTQLPGFQAATGEGGVAELPSTSELTGPAQQQSSEFRNTLQRLSGGSATGVSRPPANLPEAWRTDLDSAFKGLKALSGGVKAVDSGTGDALGGLGSLYNLASSAEAGNPIGVAQGAIGAYGALTNLTGVTPIASSLISAAPEVASAIVNAVTGAATTATTVTAAGLSAALSTIGGAAAPIIQGIVEYIGNAEQMRARDSGWWNNPIKGALYSNATEGVGRANTLLGSLGNLSSASTADLGAAVTGGANSLMPYFATAQGGRGAVRASDTVTGKNQGVTSNSQPYTGDNASPAQYTQNFTDASSGLVAAVQELLNRGVPYEAVGQLPVSGNWANQTLDAGNRPEDMMRLALQQRPELAAEAAGLYGTYGISPYESVNEYGTTTYRQPEQMQSALLERLLGASTSAPADVSKASGLATEMYGGPLWTALARMGVGGPDIQGLIQQHFDPWVAGRTPQLQAAWAPKPTPEDLQRYEAAHGMPYQAPPGPEAPANPYANYWADMSAQPAPSQPALAAAPAAAEGTPTDLGGLQRLVAAARPKAGTLAPDVPDEFSQAARNPAVLQSLLAQPGLLARLFAPQGAA